MSEGSVSRGGPTRLFYVATMAHMDGIGRFLASPTGARFAGRVVPVTYERLFRRMTPAYWWQRAREARWDYGAAPTYLRRPYQRRAARKLVGHVLRYLRAPTVPPRGHYIFSDLEILSEDEAQRAA